jgi:hypothetical protein
MQTVFRVFVGGVGGAAMKTYHKIETVWERDMEGSKKLIEGQFRNPTVAMLQNLFWDWTEKIDGTNIRVRWDGHSVSFGGRTDNANIPAPLVNRLNELFGGETNAQIFEQKFGENEVILFGEGYGAKIQACGGLYKHDGVDFILFDVMVGDMFLRRDSVEEIAWCFCIQAVPIVLRGDIDDAVAFVRRKPRSTIGTAPMEGLVGRLPEELYDRRGNRIIVKVKVRDFV